MPEIEEPLDDAGPRAQPSLGLKPWILGGYALALGLSIFGAVGQDDRFQWGQVGFITAIGLGTLAMPPTFTSAARHRRVLQLLSGVIFLIAAGLVLSSQGHHGVQVVLGSITVLLGVFFLLPAVFPAIGRKYPKQFGNHW